MSIETTKDGKQALRVEVRSMEDGWTRAGLQLEQGGPWFVLLEVPRQHYEASPDVQAKVIDLARAVVISLVSSCPGLEVEQTKVVAPGASMDAPMH